MLKINVRNTSMMESLGLRKWQTYLERRLKAIFEHFFEPCLPNAVCKYLEWQAKEDKEITQWINASFYSAAAWIEEQRVRFEQWGMTKSCVDKACEWKPSLLILCWPCVISVIFLLQCFAYSFFAVIHALLFVFYAVLVVMLRGLIGLSLLFLLPYVFWMYVLLIVFGVSVFVIILLCCINPVVWWLEQEYSALTAKVKMLSQEHQKIRCTATLVHNDYTFLNKSRSVTWYGGHTSVSDICDLLGAEKKLKRCEELRVEGFADLQSLVKKNSGYVKDDWITLRIEIEVVKERRSRRKVSQERPMCILCLSEAQTMGFAHGST